MKVLVEIFQDNLNWFQSTQNFIVQFPDIYRVPSVVSNVMAQFDQNKYFGEFGQRNKLKRCPKKLDPRFYNKGSALRPP